MKYLEHAHLSIKAPIGNVQGITGSQVMGLPYRACNLAL